MAGNLNYMNGKDVIDSNLGLLGRRLFGQGNEMGRLRESVHYGQNYHIALGGREGSNKIERDVGPGSRRDRQWLK